VEIRLAPSPQNREFDQIVMLERGEEKRLFTAKEWDDTKVFLRNS